MGTTKTAMQAGPIASVFVVAIEGYKYLLTNHGSAAAVATAWAGTDWASSSNVLPGSVFLDLQNVLQLHPWSPFQSGGKCSISVVGESGEQLAVDLAKTAGGAICTVTANVTRSTTTIAADNTTDFPASGEAFLGNECFSYSAKGATSFTVTTRGLYSPFSNCEANLTHFPRRASVGVLDQYHTSPLPVVTQYRRTWLGAWVGVWEHRVVNGVLDTRAEAQLVFGGTIDSISEDEMGASVINVAHVLDYVASQEIFVNQYRATLQRGCYVKVGDILDIHEQKSGATPVFSAVLRVAAVASLPGTIAAGMYTADELIAFINASLAALYHAGTITGVHSLALVGDQVYDTHAFPNALSTDVYYASMIGTGAWIWFLGGKQVPTSAGTTYNALWEQPLLYKTSFTFALPNKLKAIEIGASGTPAISVTDEEGTFINNGGALLPAEYGAYANGANAVGFFLLDDKILIAGRISGGQLLDARWVLEWNPAASIPGAPSTFTPKISGTKIRQIWIMTRTFWEFLAYLYNSTGDVGFNTIDFDVLPYGLGLEIPNELFSGPTGTQLIVSDAQSLPVATREVTVWITKPTKVAELLSIDFILRTSYPSWRDGVLRFATWQTPTADTATITLGEDNKAEPANHATMQRATSIVDSAWARPIVKIQFDYDPIGNTFATDVVLYDRISLDAGQKSAVTLAWKNGGSGDHSAQYAKDLISSFVGVWQTYLARPITRLRRSIDQRFFEGYAPGDVALITDKQARDPATGQRGTTARPALLLRHTYSPGGARARENDSPTIEPQVGEVDLLVVPDNKFAIWSPAAEVDETANTSGFTAGYNSLGPTLRTKSHVHSEASENLDASHFATNDVIFITETDPAMGTAPDRWTRTIASVSGGDITLTVALSSPAFSSTKRYRITSADYASAVTSQRTDAYQADDADGRIENLAPPYMYGLPAPGIGATELVHTDLAELDPTGVCAGDGVPFDTGYGLALAKTANNLIDHKTAIQGPALSTTVMTYSLSGLWVGTPTYRLVETRLRFFGAGRLGVVGRELAVAPWIASTTGTSTVRVTISQARPAVDPTSGVTDFGGSYFQVTFTSSTTAWATATEQLLDLAYCNANGTAWVSLEVSANAQTRGLAQCIVRERT